MIKDYSLDLFNRLEVCQKSAKLRVASTFEKESMTTRYTKAEIRPKAKNRTESSTLYLEFSYYSQDKQRLVRQRKTFRANELDTLEDRLTYLGLFKDALNSLLKDGWTPEKNQEYLKDPEGSPSEILTKKDQLNNLSLSKAIEIGLTEKKKFYSTKKSYGALKSFVSLFERWVNDRFGYNPMLIEVNRQVAVDYLGELKEKGYKASTVNSTLRHLRALFQALVDGEYMAKNPFEKIKTLKEAPVKHKVFTKDQVQEIGQRAQQIAPGYKLFLSLIGYAFLRPVSLHRMKVDWIDTERHLIMVGGKDEKTRKRSAIPIIPQIREALYKHIEHYTDDFYLFGPYMNPSKKPANQWLFGKKFKLIKDDMGLGPEYTMYGLRHTFIGDLYKSINEQTGNHEATLNRLQLITRHGTHAALEKYLREIGAVQPEGFEDLFTLKF